MGSSARRRGTGPGSRRSGATPRGAAARPPRRQVSATRRPSRGATNRPRGRPSDVREPRPHHTRQVAPKAGQRRRAAAMVLSPLARQIVALGLALSVVALSLAYPIRGYLQQQAAEQQALEEQHTLESQIADLEAQEAALKDPAYIKAEAKRRLQYVSPGDIVYVVKVPGADLSSSGQAGSSGDTSRQQESAVGTSTGTTANDPGAIDSSAADSAEDDGATNGSGDDALGDDDGTWYSSLWGTLTGDEK